MFLCSDIVLEARRKKTHENGAIVNLDDLEVDFFSIEGMNSSLKNRPCQDAGSVYRAKEGLVVALSDGASSSAYSKFGAAFLTALPILFGGERLMNENRR